MTEQECEDCKYNRLMTAWGETFMACWYHHDTGNELYGGDNHCSGFDKEEYGRLDGHTRGAW